ncbi:MAG: universal stress protein [Epsilonproteobacteria bacterium]|nr:MAG: universal stress protein [Campylobacterota bacterium]
MSPKKMLFPVGGGDELESRINGALLVSKHFNTHLEVQLSEATVSSGVPTGVVLPNEIVDKLEKIQLDNLKTVMSTHRHIFDECCKKIAIVESETPINNQATAHLTMTVGLRSTIVAQQTKFCDMVIAAAPQKGVATATFEAAVLESGKPVMVIPRAMKEFKTDKVIIGWNNSPEVARAVSAAIPLMKEAKLVHIVSTKAYTTESLSRIRDLRNYLAMHDIETTFELIKTTFIPGEALLKTANEGKFDLIVAGAYCKKGLKEMMLGGSSRYTLEHTKIPALVSH